MSLIELILPRKDTTLFFPELSTVCPLNCSPPTSPFCGKQSFTSSPSRRHPQLALSLWENPYQRETFSCALYRREPLTHGRRENIHLFLFPRENFLCFVGSNWCLLIPNIAFSASGGRLNFLTLLNFFSTFYNTTRHVDCISRGT